MGGEIKIPNLHKALFVAGNFMMTLQLRFIILLVALTKLSVVQSQQSNELIDTTIRHVDSAVIGGKKYYGILTDQYFFLLDRRGDTVIKRQDVVFECKFKDFDGDGNRDIWLSLFSNTPAVTELYLYDPVSKNFKEVEDFSRFPAPERIRGTHYYYSYHRSGCADLNWDSDLFYIRRFKAIRVGNISGIGCGDTYGLKDGIYISSVRSDKTTLKQQLAISILKNYKDHKWGFIKSYWTKNYRLFVE